MISLFLSDALSQNSSTSYPQEVRGTQRSGVSTPEDLSPRPSVLGRPGLRVRGDGQDGDAASTRFLTNHFSVVVFFYTD